MFVNTTVEKVLESTRFFPPGNFNKFSLTWSKVLSFFSSCVWMTVQRSSEENSFISMFSLIASSASFLSLFILSNTRNLFGFGSLVKNLPLCQFSFLLCLSLSLAHCLEFYLLGIKKSKVQVAFRWLQPSKHPPAEVLLPQAESYQSPTPWLVQRCVTADWFSSGALNGRYYDGLLEAFVVCCFNCIRNDDKIV